MIAFAPPGKPERPDYVSAADLAGRLGKKTLAALANASDHQALDGSPCWDENRLADLLGLLEGGCR